MILIDRCSAHKHAISSSIRLILTIYHRPSRPTMLGAAARPGEHFSSGEGSRLIAQSIACNCNFNLTWQRPCCILHRFGATLRRVVRANRGGLSVGGLCGLAVQAA